VTRRPERSSETMRAMSLERSDDASPFAAGVRAVGPFAIAVLAFGVAFGVLARAAGFGVLAPVVMSATTFAGSAQFAAASVIGDAGTVAAAVAAALLLNARYGPIGVSVSPWLRGSAMSRLVQAQLVVDENWALAAREGGRFDRGVLLGAGVTLYVCWVIGTAVGAVVGDAFGDPATLGLDAAFPALFLALLVPQLGDRRKLQAAILGAGIALILTPLAPVGVPIVAASGACLLGARR
jgi:4-azaleucine resistance transporter AzlC